MIALRRLSRFIALCVLGGVGVGACLAGLVPGVAFVAGSSRYSGDVASQLHRLEQPTTVYDDQGAVLDVVGTQDRRPVKLAQVPKVLVDAVVATEDRTFYTNPGVDLPSLVRALITNVGSGGVEQGGSTITQQLIKQRYFTNPKRDLNRKVREAVLALRLNQEWSKNRILEEYLNTVYFGQGSYGVKAAAERFFGTPLSKVDLAQASLLAGVISNPEGDNPFTNPNGARARRLTTLRRMLTQHYITGPEAFAAALAPLPTVKPPAALQVDNYYVDTVQQRLLDPSNHTFDMLGTDAAARADSLFQGGLRVYTAYDPRLSALAQQAVNTTVPVSRFVPAMAVMDPTTGWVPAIVAGPGFEKSQFNLATGGSGGRSAGSAFKPITLAVALDKGYSPYDTVSGTSPCTIKFDGYAPWKTHNDEGEGIGGYISLRTATVDSVNCAYANLERSFGNGPAALQPIVAMATRLGISRKPQLQPSITLGSAGGVSPLDMATAYSVFADDGIRHDPVFITKVVNAAGRTVYSAPIDGTRVLDTQTARTISNILQGVITGGTGYRADIGRPAAGKTGTTDGPTDAWFVGYTPQLTAAVWMGNPATGDPSNPAAIMSGVGRFGAIYGGTYPALVWKAFMQTALEGQPKLEFPPPDKALWPPGRTLGPDGRGTRAYVPRRPTTTTTTPTDTTPTSGTGASPTTPPGPPTASTEPASGPPTGATTGPAP